jgi:hypothetical protein
MLQNIITVIGACYHICSKIFYVYAYVDIVYIQFTCHTRLQDFSSSTCFVIADLQTILYA